MQSMSTILVLDEEVSKKCACAEDWYIWKYILERQDKMALNDAWNVHAEVDWKVD